MGVGTGSVEEWFKSGERVSVTFHVSELDTAVRTQHVCCHVIEPPLTTRPPRPHKHTTTTDSTGANAGAGAAAAAAGTAGVEGAAAVVGSEDRGSGVPAQGAAVDRSSSNVLSSQALVQQDEEGEEEEEEDVPAVTFLHGYPTSSFDYSKVIEILSRTQASDLLAAAARSTTAATATAAPATGSKAAAGASANNGVGSDATAASAPGHTNGVHEKSEGAPQSHSSSHPDLTGLSGLAALGCRCILIDLLGYGNSDKGVGEARFSVQQQANLITQVWQHYGVTRTHLVAHDFSVSVAQELLMREPKDRLGGVELGKVLWLNGSVFVDLYAPLAVEKLLGQRATGWAAGAVMGRAAFCALLSQKFSKEHPAAQQVLDDAYWAMCQNGGQKILHKLTRYMKDRERYKRVWQGALELAIRRDPKRMLFFWGMQDPVSGAHIAAQLHARFDRYGHPGLIQEHADLGHWPHVEDPHRVAAALLAFFTEGGEGGSAAWRRYLPSPKPFELDLHIEICSVARGRFSTDGAAPGTSAGGGATTTTGAEVAGSTHGGGGGGGGFFTRRSVEISRRSVEAYRKQASSTLTGRTSLHYNGSLETSRHGRTSATLFNRTSAQKLSRAPSGNTSGLLGAAASALGIGAAASTPAAGAAVQAAEPPSQTTTTTTNNNNNTKPTANATSAAANSSSTWHAAPTGADGLAAGVVVGEVGVHPSPLDVAAEQVRSASSTPQGSSSNVALPGQAI